MVLASILVVISVNRRIKSLKYPSPIKYYYKVLYMLDKINAERTGARFITPAVIMIVGLVASKAPVASLITAPVHIVQTLGFGLFTLGALSFVLILNHARNPVLTDQKSELIRLAEVSAAYGGILVFLKFEQILPLDTLLLSVGIVLIIGTTVAVVSDATGVSRENAVQDYS